MKSILSVLLVFALLLPIMLKVWILVDFKINQDFISDVLCISRTDPVSTCNGKCHLKKQLNKIEKEKEEEKRLPLQVYDNRDLNYFAIGEYVISFEKLFSKDSFFISKYQNIYSFLYIQCIWHPPKVL